MQLSLIKFCFMKLRVVCGKHFYVITIANMTAVRKFQRLYDKPKLHSHFYTVVASLTID